MHEHHIQFSNRHPTDYPTETGYGSSEMALAFAGRIGAAPRTHDIDQILAAADRLRILATGGLPTS